MLIWFLAMYEENHMFIEKIEKEISVAWGHLGIFAILAKPLLGKH